MSSWSATAHKWVSRNALLPLSRLQRRAHPSRRPTIEAFDESMRFRKESVSWSDDQRRAWILERLRFSVRRAHRETTYYRELFNRVGFDPQADFSFDDYAKLPVLEREAIRLAGKEIVSTAVDPRQLQKDATGGSTGEPTTIWLGPEERGWRDAAKEHFLELIGAPAGVPAANYWGHHLDPVTSDSLRERFYNFAHNTRWFDCFRQSPEVFEQYHKEFERWRPVRINAYASALGYFAEYLLEKGYQPNYPTQCFETGAEKLLPHHREAIEKAFRRPVHERYGSRDAGYIGFQIQPTRTLDYQIDWSNIMLEPETEEPDSPILITKLHADGMPMLRYRIGDLGRFPAGSKPGHPTLTLHEVIGRETERVWLPDGRFVIAILLPHMMKDQPVREFMFHQQADYSVELSIVPKNGFDEKSRQEILKTVNDNLPGIAVSLNLVDQIPRTKANKWRPVLSDVKPLSGESK